MVLFSFKLQGNAQPMKFENPRRGMSNISWKVQVALWEKELIVFAFKLQCKAQPIEFENLRRGMSNIYWKFQITLWERELFFD